jgi:hypothetical protein
MTLNSTVKALIACVRNITDTQRTNLLSNEERSKQLRQHNVAVNYAIKVLVEELQKLKIAEKIDPNVRIIYSQKLLTKKRERKRKRKRKREKTIQRND